ncbi:unnamed protein product [Polarella glacialis]|uniref:Uncharacterized protein n=2 Tax=Polarella glacialis TaxID=89957 RepID=A0A813FEA0_POLGL|nr:unnamed protein product [Polarella glacialis]
MARARLEVLRDEVAPRSRTPVSSQCAAMKLPPARGRLVSQPRHMQSTGGAPLVHTGPRLAGADSSDNICTGIDSWEVESMSELKEALRVERETTAQLRVELEASRDEVHSLRELLRPSNSEGALDQPGSALDASGSLASSEHMVLWKDAPSQLEPQRRAKLPEAYQDYAVPLLPPLPQPCSPEESMEVPEEQRPQLASWEAHGDQVQRPPPLTSWPGLEEALEEEVVPTARTDHEEGRDLSEEFTEGLQIRSPETGVDKGSYIRAAGKVYWLSYEDPSVMLRLPDCSAFSSASSSTAPAPGSSSQRGRHEELSQQNLSPSQQLPGQGAEDPVEKLLPGTPEQWFRPSLLTDSLQPAVQRLRSGGSVFGHPGSAGSLSARGQLQGHQLGRSGSSAAAELPGSFPLTISRLVSSEYHRYGTPTVKVAQGSMTRALSSGPCGPRMSQSWVPSGFSQQVPVSSSKASSPGDKALAAPHMTSMLSAPLLTAPISQVARRNFSHQPPHQLGLVQRRPSSVPAGVSPRTGPGLRVVLASGSAAAVAATNSASSGRLYSSVMAVTPRTGQLSPPPPPRQLQNQLQHDDLVQQLQQLQQLQLELEQQQQQHQQQRQQQHQYHQHPPPASALSAGGPRPTSQPLVRL